jgi:hypothetical protein
MNSNFHLTINELPKTKKMQVDENHPILKIRQNVFHIINCRNSHMMKKKMSKKLELCTAAPCQ